MNTPIYICWILLILGLLGFLYIYGSQIFNVGLRQAYSQTSGEIYQVRDQPGYSAKAELLGQLHKNLRLVVQTLAPEASHHPVPEASHDHVPEAPNDLAIQRLIKGFENTQLVERNGPHRFTSYSVNKGQQIVLCLNKSDNCDASNAECPLIDLNTLTFVGLHELSHIMTVSIDDQSDSHSAEFWQNYSMLLKTAQELGLYQSQNYQIVPVEYCGQLIENSPLL